MAYDLHTHTNWCDGKNTPEEVVLSAIDKGLTTIGVLAHSYCDFEPEYFLHYSKIDAFIEEINRLKEKYSSKIKVLCGVEQDTFSSPLAKTKGFDYILGSVHNFKVGDKYYPMDFTEEILVGYVNEVFNGNIYDAIDNYFESVSEIVERTNANIIGHFDLIKKFNIDGKLFDENHPRYISAWKKAVDKLIPYGVPFEINIGGLIRVRGQDKPYPSNQIMEYIKSKGGKFIYGSDSHVANTVGSYFEDWKDKVIYEVRNNKL